ncbi:polysaccharide deacetylase family protein [Actinoplanes sp. KI2]|uniref:polysaccharide deacetylase family protein n=1 Tax=Actinoplanes sp. KI2 TaxID=2983315 RepID=UPI0021D5E3C5|nr:polysaccharide deacetylase family protein [Actinoplanes sp. KI2]MCU7729980.1 polysaccharide deacetylase family protein [Actinoplanes sp. KI2]
MRFRRSLVAAVLIVAGCSSHGAPSGVHGSATAAPPPGRSAAATDRDFDGIRLPVFASPPPAEPVTAPSGALAPMYRRLAVHQRVAFLTMDDGQVQLPTAGSLMAAAHVPFTMFLIGPVAAKNPPFFERLVGEGGVIEDHTLTHPSMRGLPYATQRYQICGARDLLRTTFHSTPRFFRPPYGNYDENTLRAVHDCGLQAAFNWTETVNNGKVYYQTPVHRIEPGDIILMHFRPAFVSDVTAALTAIHRSGLTPALLENYVN